MSGELLCTRIFVTDHDVLAVVSQPSLLPTATSIVLGMSTLFLLVMIQFIAVIGRQTAP